MKTLHTSKSSHAGVKRSSGFLPQKARLRVSMGCLNSPVFATVDLLSLALFHTIALASVAHLHSRQRTRPPTRRLCRPWPQALPVEQSMEESSVAQVHGRPNTFE